MAAASRTEASRVGPVIDSNVHLWEQSRNPVFWLTDRAMVRDIIGDYDALPDTYTLTDYADATSAFDVRGAVWSDAGAADSVAAAEWVRAQNTDGLVIGLVALADPADPAFAEVVEALQANPLVTSVRLRLVPALQTGVRAASTEGPLLDALERLADGGLVATIEAAANQLSSVAALARRIPRLCIVLDHFGWPDDLSDAGRAAHLALLRHVADEPNLTTRIDAIGTIFGDWDVETLRPWLHGVVEAFGSARCMLGSDLPIETLRSTFSQLYDAYDTIFDSYTDDERRLLFGATARRVYGSAPTPVRDGPGPATAGAGTDDT